MTTARPAFDELLAKSPRPRSAVFLFGLLAALMGWRFLAVAWDFGGFFFQLWISLVGTAGYVAALVLLNGTYRIVAGSGFFLVVALLSLGTIYFAPQALFPFLFFVGAMAAAVWLRFKSKPRYALLVLLLLIPLGAYCIHGLSDMATIIRFRKLAGAELQAIEFTNLETKQKILIESPEARNRIVASLAHTTPYSPNHEGVRNAWEFSLRLKHGSVLRCVVGKGNRAHPEAAWISFGESVYQNADLMRVLKRDAPGLWPVATNTSPQ